MARGPTYRVPFRRRREKKTNYYLRRSLLLSGKLRVVIRPTVKNITCQVCDALLQGDKVLASAHSTELRRKFGWKYNTGNLPASYLTGYLLGKRALKAGVTEAIADIGLRVHMNRTWAALKGVIDAGLDVPHSDEIFPDDERIKGAHIGAYQQFLKDAGAEESGEEEKPETEDNERSAIASITRGAAAQFKRFNDENIDLSRIPDDVEATKEKIDKELA